MVLFVLVTTIGASAKHWVELSPLNYIAKNTKIVNARKSPCNKGKEAFIDFIKKFRTNDSFRHSRLRFENEEETELFIENIEPYMFLVKAFKNNTKCDKSFGTWFNVHADEVCFRYEDEDVCNEDGGLSISIRFQRFNGKWFCTGFFIAG